MENQVKPSVIDTLKAKYQDITIAPQYVKVRDISDNGDETSTVYCFANCTMYLWQPDIVEKCKNPNDARRWFEANLNKIQIDVQAESKDINPKTNKPYPAKIGFGFWDNTYDDVIEVSNFVAKKEVSKSSGKDMWTCKFELELVLPLKNSTIEEFGLHPNKSGFIAFYAKVKGKNKIRLLGVEKYEAINAKGIEDSDEVEAF